MIKESFMNSFVSPGMSVDFEGKQVNPEVKVSVAIGKVDKIDKGNGDNWNVTIKVAGAKFDFRGFINASEPAAKVFEQAMERDVPIVARFEKKRKIKNSKGPISPLTPIDELSSTMDIARDNIVNTCVGIYNINAEQWILTSEAQTNPEVDPDYVMSTINKAQASTDGFFDEAPVAQVRVPKTYADERANHLMSMYIHMFEQAAENGYEMTDKKAKYFAKVLIQLVDSLQMSIYGLDAPNYRDYSHTRARYVLFSYAKMNPLTEEVVSSQESIRAWGEQFIEFGRDLWVWAIKDSQPTDVSNE